MSYILHIMSFDVNSVETSIIVVYCMLVLVKCLFVFEPLGMFC